MGEKCHGWSPEPSLHRSAAFQLTLIDCSCLPGGGRREEGGGRREEGGGWREEGGEWREEGGGRRVEGGGRREEGGEEREVVRQVL